jgi:hypothetical protein
MHGIEEWNEAKRDRYEERRWANPCGGHRNAHIQKSIDTEELMAPRVMGPGVEWKARKYFGSRFAVMVVKAHGWTRGVCQTYCKARRLGEVDVKLYNGVLLVFLAPRG